MLLLLDDEESDKFKGWVIKKLEQISDGQEIADPDVLADYVLALVGTDEAEAVARANCVENLKDFLGDKADRFVTEAFLAISAKNFDANKPPAKPSGAVYDGPRRYSFEPPRQPNESRKRSYHDWNAEEVQNGRSLSFEGGDRAAKQPRRGARGWYDARGGRQYQSRGGAYGRPPSAPFDQIPQGMQLPPMPTPLPAMPIPPYDPNNQMSAVMAVAQMMSTIQPTPSKTGQRCRDYDTKGFCTRGAACPYDHGENPFVVPQQSNEYDPTKAVMANITPSRVASFDSGTSPSQRGGGARGRGRGSDSPWRGGGKRSECSRLGPSEGRSVTSLVIEQIPEESFSEESVREYFSQFGNIEQVTMQPHRRLAIVRYDIYDSANAAYQSPKSVFDNRFVKVYWYKAEKFTQPPSNGRHVADHDYTDVEMEQQAPDFDYEEVARRQEEAQRKHDELKRQREEADRRKSDIDTQLKAMDAERQKTMALLAKKRGGKAASPETNGGADTEQTKALKAKLAELEREARGLGIDPDAVSVVTNGYGGNSYGSSPYRGRGGYRGRARGRGHFQTSYRGGYGGSGHGGGGGFGGRVTKSLDNRPKTIEVVFTDGAYREHEESLKQYLMFNGLETAVLSPHPTKEDTALVSFQQRFEGENFMDAAAYQGPLAASDLPKQLGKVKMSWCKTANGAAAPTEAPSSHRNGPHANGDVKMEAAYSVEAQLEYQEAPAQAREDMDTYDEE